MSDPFNVSKIDGNEFKENISILHDNICTLSMFSEKKICFVRFDEYFHYKKYRKIILEAIEKINKNTFTYY